MWFLLTFLNQYKRKKIQKREQKQALAAAGASWQTKGRHEHKAKPRDDVTVESNEGQPTPTPPKSQGQPVPSDMKSNEPAQKPTVKPISSRRRQKYFDVEEVSAFLSFYRKIPPTFSQDITQELTQSIREGERSHLETAFNPSASNLNLKPTNRMQTLEPPSTYTGTETVRSQKSFC